MNWVFIDIFVGEGKGKKMFPIDVRLYIFSKLEFADAKHISQTCTFWRECIHSKCNPYWFRKIRELGFEDEEYKKQHLVVVAASVSAFAVRYYELYYFIKHCKRFFLKKKIQTSNMQNSITWLEYFIERNCHFGIKP